MKWRLANIFVMSIATMALAQAQGNAELAGCVSDTMAQRLPGATVVATGGGVRRTTEADTSGCYELKGLPSGSYRVTTRLPAFDNLTHDDVHVAAATVTHLDFAMHVSAICECISFADQSLTNQWTLSDAVLHVRLSAADPDEPTHSGYYGHVATVLDDLKPSAAGRSRTGRLLVLQNQRNAAPEPYDVGQELIVFLMSQRSDMFVILDDRSEEKGSDTHAMAFLIQDGAIRRAPERFSSYVGQRFEVLQDELRALSRRAP